MSVEFNSVTLLLLSGAAPIIILTDNPRRCFIHIQNLGGGLLHYQFDKRPRVGLPAPNILDGHILQINISYTTPYPDGCPRGILYVAGTLTSVGVSVTVTEGFYT